ncbi:hypothetical protein GCM10022416_53180 [Actinomadura keratinilytica]|uniref:Uncharacterized protein n=1 Tax=Actinomadura keratinilytica TaxID=547461 RepID=A0ABP7ZCW6_9ACTN
MLPIFSPPDGAYTEKRGELERIRSDHTPRPGGGGAAPPAAPLRARGAAGGGPRGGPVAPKGESRDFGSSSDYARE